MRKVGDPKDDVFVPTRRYRILIRDLGAVAALEEIRRLQQVAGS